MSNSLIKDLLEQSGDYYESTRFKDASGQPRKFRVQRIAVLDLASEGLIPYGATQPKQANPLIDKDRQEALKGATMLAPGQVLSAEALEQVRSCIRVINQGCPELSGQVFATFEECPKDDNNARTALLFTDLADDFMGLFFTIMRLSNDGANSEKTKEKVQHFRSQGSRGKKTVPGVQDVQPTSIPNDGSRP